MCETYAFVQSMRIQGLRAGRHQFVTMRNKCDADGTAGMKRLTAVRMIQPVPEKEQGTTESGQVRVRQHVNPLARRWSQPIDLPRDWYKTAFSDLTLPLTIDIGVAKGRFLLKFAPSQQKKRNFLGLEIREPLVHQANRIAAQDGLENLLYLACNVNVSFSDIMLGIPAGMLEQVFIQFCDPWFKKRHAKRRIVTPQLVNDIFSALKDAADHTAHPDLERHVFIQSDVEEVAIEMRDLLDNHAGFLRLGAEHNLTTDEQGWLTNNPIGAPTEREIAVEKKGLKVYRALFRLSL